MRSDNSRQQNQHPYRSLPVHEWPEADRKAFEEACRPGLRLKPGGRASHFAEASLKDFTNRYAAYLGSLQRKGVLNPKAAAAAQVTRPNVKAYVVELKARKVSSVTIWNCIYKLRRASQLLDPKRDFGWLIEIENEAALVMTPRSKFSRLVLTNRLVEAGLTLIAEAERHGKSRFDRARGIRNGLMIVILALTQIRLKNFVALEIGRSFKEVDGSWWVSVPGGSTKNKRWIEKRIPNAFTRIHIVALLSSSSECHAYAGRAATAALKLILLEDDAQQRADLFARLSRAILPANRSEANLLFKRGLTELEAIGSGDHDFMNELLAFATSIRGGPVKSTTALRLAKICELNNYDSHKFPWPLCAKAFSRIWGTKYLAQIARWHETLH